mmetsp:Transcript_18500/g.32069  ORF Transcript_18500/g.32069 Transcript_18500/m.32069 type:complete len:204 (-) Transcript_18500:536-1147(-)
MVTARGSPSGMATTTRVMDTNKWFKNGETLHAMGSGCSGEGAQVTTLTTVLTDNTANVSTAAARPSLPIISANQPNFTWRGVSAGLPRVAMANLPAKELTPTLMISTRPSPSVTLVPLMKKGSCAGDFFIISVSPVTADSSHFRSCPWRNTPSAAIDIPAATNMTSPTTNSEISTDVFTPFRITSTSFLDCSADISSNFLALL